MAVLAGSTQLQCARANNKVSSFDGIINGIFKRWTVDDFFGIAAALTY